VDAEVRLSCTPSQHISSRGLFDRFRALWGSWVVEDLRSHKRAYFAGDTAFRAVRHDAGGEEDQENNVPVCPAFAEVGERFGCFEVALQLIGCASHYMGCPNAPGTSLFVRNLTPIWCSSAYSPRSIMHRSCLVCMPHLQMLCAYSGM
jgi:hypothetical protein